MNLEEYKDLIPFLKKLGLNDSEIQTYLSAFAIGGPQTSGTLSKRAKLKQSTTSMALKSLMQKGLMSGHKKNNNQYYIPEDPEKLISYLKVQKINIDALESEIKSILPTIKNIKPSSQNKPKIKIYEGSEAIKKVFLEMMELDEEILGYFSLSKEIDAQFDKFWGEYFKKMKASKKHLKAIVPNNKEGQSFQKNDKSRSHTTLLVPADKYNFECEKHIAGNTVAQIIIDQDNLVAIVIEDERIASTERLFFELAWRSLKLR